jgi:hypothetical protein
LRLGNSLSGNHTDIFSSIVWKNLVHLEISGSDSISDSELKTFSKGISLVSALRVLSLINCGVVDSQIRSDTLVKILCSTDLRELSLSGNPFMKIKEGTIIKLALAILSNPEVRFTF